MINNLFSIGAVSGLFLFGMSFGVPDAAAHTESGTDMMQSGTMGEMMELMHGRLDGSQATPCSDFTDEQLMEEGETIMDEMMGHEDHERVEEAMEQDMHDHDAMHTMMGMMGTGCVGRDAAGLVASRYGFMAKDVGGPMGTSGVTSRDVSTMIGAFVVGLVVGMLGIRMFKKRTPTA